MAGDVFLLINEDSALVIPSEMMPRIDGVIRVLETTPNFDLYHRAR